MKPKTSFYYYSSWICTSYLFIWSFLLVVLSLEPNWLLFSWSIFRYVDYIFQRRSNDEDYPWLNFIKIIIFFVISIILLYWRIYNILCILFLNNSIMMFRIKREYIKKVIRMHCKKSGMKLFFRCYEILFFYSYNWWYLWY